VSCVGCVLFFAVTSFGTRGAISVGCRGEGGGVRVGLGGVGWWGETRGTGG